MVKISLHECTLSLFDEPSCVGPHPKRIDIGVNVVVNVEFGDCNHPMAHFVTSWSTLQYGARETLSLRISRTAAAREVHIGHTDSNDIHTLTT